MIKKKTIQEDANRKKENCKKVSFGPKALHDFMKVSSTAINPSVIHEKISKKADQDLPI